VRPMFDNVIHIEGMDLAGKSMVTKTLSGLFLATVTRNSLVANNEIYVLTDTLRRGGAASAVVLGHLYVAALARDLELLERPAGPRIQDSTILLRSAAFYHVLGRHEFVKTFARMAEEHPRFGATVVLTASIEARLERLEIRARDNPDEVAPDDLAVKQNPDQFLAMEAVLLNYACAWFDAAVIDTSNRTPTQVVCQVLDHLRTRGFGHVR
jgi:thymidylate kinase